jgi:predicted nucleotidyltransferase
MQTTTPPVPSSIRDVLRWATASLQNLYGSRLKRLILFGSYARGEAHEESDVDLLVVLDGPVRSHQEAKRTSRIAIRAAAYRDTALSFIHLSAEALADDRRPLVRTVKEEGIDLLSAPFTLPRSRSKEPTKATQ